MEKVVDATVARRQLGTLLDEVYYKGESIIIKRKGKALAKIVPMESTETIKDKKRLIPVQKQLLAELHSLPTFEMEEEPTDILRKIRRTRSEKAREQYGK